MNYKSKKSAWKNLNVLEVALFAMFNFPTPENRLAVEHALEHLSLHKDAQQLTARQAISQWIPKRQKKTGGMVLSVARIPIVATRTALRPLVSHKPELLAALAAAALVYDYKYNRFEVTGDILSIGTERVIASTVGRLGWTAFESSRMVAVRTELYIEQRRSPDTALVPTVDLFDSNLWTVGPFNALLPSVTALSLDIVTLIVWVAYDHWRLPKGGTVNIPSVANEFGELWKQDRGFRNKPVQFSPETFVLRVALVYSATVALQAMRNLDLYDWTRAEKVDLGYAGAQFAMNAIQVFWALTSGYLFRKWWYKLYPNPSANKQLLQTATREIEQRVPTLTDEDLVRAQATAAERTTAEDELDQQNSLANVLRTAVELGFNRQQPQPQQPSWTRPAAVVYETTQTTQRVTVTPMFAPLQLHAQPSPNLIANNVVAEQEPQHRAAIEIEEEEPVALTATEFKLNLHNAAVANERAEARSGVQFTNALPSELFPHEWAEAAGSFNAASFGLVSVTATPVPFNPTHQIDIPSGEALYEWLCIEAYRAGGHIALLQNAVANETLPLSVTRISPPPKLSRMLTAGGGRSILPKYNNYVIWLLALGATGVQLKLPA